jgi:PKD repeat protein
MKSIFKISKLYFLLAAFAGFLLASCSPEEFSGSLGPAPTSELVKFSATPDPANPNIIKFKNETPGTVTAVWDLGNGITGDGTEINGSYAVKGAYTVKLTVFTKGGYAANTQTVNIAQTNVSMLNREDYNFLTGGATAANGKTWRVEGETKGHLGVGPSGAATPEWWSAGANEKASEGLYDDRVTFNLNGFKFTNNNKGNTFANFEFVTDLGAPAASGDVTVPYTPAANTGWSIVEEGGKKFLVISGGGFIGYYTGTTRYEILSLTADELYIKGISKKPSDGWWQRLVREDYVRPIEAKPIKSADIFDNFDQDGNVSWKKEALTLNESYDNPLPLPVNTSAKAAMYVKQEGSGFMFANMFADFNYKFDLATRNKFTLKVYIPGSNDFTTAAGESWANPRLLKQVSVKLQDGTSSQPWVNQVEVVQQVTQTDRWVELTFDFSGAVSRKDLDRIVIQIGGEGNHIAGLFYLDDFKLL